MKSILTFGGLLTLCLAMASTANAIPVTLDFDGVTSTGASYTENGLTISATSAEPVRIGSGRWYLDCCDPGPETFSLATGGTFDLLSIFIRHVDNTDPVVWNGYFDGNLVASTSFNTGQGSTYNFSGFTGLDLVTMSVSGIWTDSSFDNLTYEAVAEEVPEPSTLALIGLGLVGLGYSRKKAA